MTSAPCNSLNNAGAKVPVTSDDFPEPDTPVTAIIQPSGISTSRSRKLFCLAPLIVSILSTSGVAGSSGRGIAFRPER